ncbi:MAG: group I truncated hemoglobin [bacterium]
MEQSLYDKYGGFSAVSKIVHEFYRRILESDLLAPYFRNADMQRLMDHQIRFFSTLLGGPVTYDDEQLDRIHRRLNITEAAFDEVLDLLAEVLEDSGVAGGDSDTILGSLSEYKAGFVGADH